MNQRIRQQKMRKGPVNRTERVQVVTYTTEVVQSIRLLSLFVKSAYLPVNMLNLAVAALTLMLLTTTVWAQGKYQQLHTGDLEWGERVECNVPINTL